MRHGHGLNSPSSPCRVPAQVGAGLKVGEPAAYSPTTTTLMALQEASLKTSLARKVLCLKGSRSLGPLPNLRHSILLLLGQKAWGQA